MAVTPVLCYYVGLRHSALVVTYLLPCMVALDLHAVYRLTAACDCQSMAYGQVSFQGLWLRLAVSWL